MFNKIILVLNIVFITIAIWVLPACDDNAQTTSDTAPGHLEAQYQLAQDYLNNTKGKNDAEVALQLLRSIADQGYTPAQNKLGYLYSSGLHVPKDPLLALQWYEIAARNGFAVSQYNLAEMYRFGYGTDKDDHSAFNWYEKSAIQGYPNAMLRMAESYKSGAGTDENLVRAYAWYQLVKENGINVPDIFTNSIARQLTDEQLVETEILITEIKREMNISKQ